MRFIGNKCFRTSGEGMPPLEKSENMLWRSYVKTAWKGRSDKDTFVLLQKCYVFYCRKFGEKETTCKHPSFSPCLYAQT